MYIVLGVFVVAYLLTAYTLKWRGVEKERLSIKDSIVVALIPAAIAAVIIGGGLWAVAYQYHQDPVEVNYSIVEGPNGNYIDEGTYGEYNEGATYWYYRDGDSVRRTWKDSSYVNLNWVDSDERACVQGMCDSSETVPHWLLLPWERDEDHIFMRECSYEDFDLFIPMGES